MPGRAQIDLSHWPAKRRKSWRTHREIKRFAGGSERCPDVDECVSAERIGAAATGSGDTEPDDAQRDAAGAAAADSERHDWAARFAAGSSAKADRAPVPPWHRRRLHQAEEPLLESDCSVYAVELSGPEPGKYSEDGPAAS